MGYNTRFELKFDTKTEEGTEVVEFLEWPLAKNKSFAELRKRLKDVDGFFQRMEAIEAKALKLFSTSDYAREDSFFYYLWTNNHDEMKWYEHEDDMKNFSKLFPKVLFTLEGTGEEAGDMWVKYFQNGKMQVAKAKIEFEPYDPKKMK
jgi:hypothetical protein